MAYDAARRKTLMVGGVGSSVRRRIWQWDGTTWTPRSPSLEPNPSYRHGVAYDSARARVMSFGGYRNPGSNRLFEWDGGEWTEVFPRRSPPPRYAHAMAYDSRRRRLVVFGGWLDNGYYSNDTWELVHDCIVVGQGHPGGGIPITCVTSPIIGSNFQIAYAASRGSGILFLGSAPVGSPFLQATPPLVCRSGTLHPTPLVVIPGTGSPVLMNFVIPLNPLLIGSRITLQAVAPQITNCFLLTDAIEIAIRK